jgi:hypothetical protein
MSKEMFDMIGAFILFIFGVAILLKGVASGNADNWRRDSNMITSVVGGFLSVIGLCFVICSWVNMGNSMPSGVPVAPVQTPNK